MELIQKKSHKAVPELEQQELPRVFWSVWEWFIKMHNKRTNNGYSPNPITYQEILAFCILEDLHLSSSEIEMINKFDNIVLQQYAKEAKKRSKDKSPKDSKKSNVKSY